MKKKFEQPQMNIISFSVKEHITWEVSAEEDAGIPGFSDTITDW